VDGDDKHEEDEECEADAVQCLSESGFNRAADDAFNNDKEESSAIERGDGD